MREIKFRGRWLEKWYYGDMMRNERVPVMHYIGSKNNFIMVEPDTVGQFTGLLDSNGKEIYEGDVVRTDDWSTPSFICWDDVTASFVVDRWSVNLAHVSQIKVIGNVHDNPNLLEVEHD